MPPSDKPTIIDARLRLGPLTARVRVTGDAGLLLTPEHIARRWGPFMITASDAPGEDETEDDLAVEFETQEGPWPRPGQPPVHSLRVVQRDGAWRVLRDDIDAILYPSMFMLEGTCAPRLPAIEECLRLLLWLHQTRSAPAGLLVHSASTVYNGKAWCFPAYGGTGKSTLATLTPGHLALCDEISMLTLEEDGQWYAWPCPFWNWDRNFHPEQSGAVRYPLAGLGFLKQSPVTRYEPMRADDALTRVMEQAVAFDAFPRSSGRTFELAADLVEHFGQRERLGMLHLLKGDDFYPVLDSLGD